MSDETHRSSDSLPEDPAPGGAVPPRTHWYFCPHWQRFLARGAQQCVLCEPAPQQPTPPTGRKLRAIFPMLDASGAPIPARTRTDQEREGADIQPPEQMAEEE